MKLDSHRLDNWSTTDNFGKNHCHIEKRLLVSGLAKVCEVNVALGATFFPKNKHFHHIRDNIEEDKDRTNDKH